MEAVQKVAATNTTPGGRCCWSKPSVTLPETNSSPLKIGHPKRKLLFQPSIFRGYISFREGIFLKSSCVSFFPATYSSGGCFYISDINLHYFGCSSYRFWIDSMGSVEITGYILTICFNKEGNQTVASEVHRRAKKTKNTSKLAAISSSPGAKTLALTKTPNLGGNFQHG